MPRHRNVEWTLPDGPSISWDAAQLAVLMDIRDKLRSLLYQQAAMVAALNRISAKLPPRKKRKKAATKAKGGRRG